MNNGNMIDLLLKKEICTNKIPAKLILEINKKNIDLIRLTKKCALEQFGIKLNTLRSIDELRTKIRYLYYDNINEWLQEQLRVCLRENTIASGYAKNKAIGIECFRSLINDNYFKYITMKLRPYQHDFMYQQASRGLDLEEHIFVSSLEKAPTEDNPYVDAAWLEIILVGVDYNNTCIECNIGMITGYIADIEMMKRESGSSEILIGKDEFLSISHIVDEFWEFLNDNYLEPGWDQDSSSQTSREQSAYMLNHIQLKKEFDSIEYVELILKLIPPAIMDLYKRRLRCIFYTPGETEMEDFTVGNGIEWPEYLDDIEVLLNEYNFKEYGEGRFCKWFN